jgi:hypothetical protein
MVRKGKALNLICLETVKNTMVLLPDGVKNVKTSSETKACQIRTSY